MQDNLWAQTILIAREQGYPILPLWAYKWLVILGVWRLIMMLSCTGILLIPLCRGKHSRRSHLWLIRRKYTSSNGSMPYLVPNKFLMIVLCEMLAAVMYFGLACLYYTCFRSPAYTPATSIVPAWCGLVLLPTYVGIWLSGWGWLYACHTSGFASKEKTTGFLKPFTFNLLSISWPLLVCIITAFFTILSTLKIEREYHNLEEFIRRLETMASNPSEYPYTSALGRNFIETIAKIWQGYLEVGVISKSHSIIWVVFGVIMVAFYGSILPPVFRRISGLLKLCESHESLLSYRTTSHQAPISHTHQIADKTSTAVKKLRVELRLLILYIFSILLVCLGEVAVSCFQVLHSNHLTNSNWLGLSSLLSMLPSTFISPILLFQCWRAFTERSSTQEPNFINPSMHESPSSQLPIFYEQLLRWYEDPEADLLHRDAFTGLIECPDDRTRRLKLNTSIGTNRSTKKLAFKITKTTHFEHETRGA